MKKFTVYIALILLVCVATSFTRFNTILNVAGTNHVITNNKLVAPLQSKVQPYCKFHYMNHEGRMVLMHTNLMHWTAKSMTFMFDGGERLIINFSNSIRVGNFNIESAATKDPHVLFYASHTSSPVTLTGSFMVFGMKPINGAFPHLISNGNDHVTIMSGSFSF